MKSLFLDRELIHNQVLKGLKFNYNDSIIGFLGSLLYPLRIFFYS